MSHDRNDVRIANRAQAQKEIQTQLLWEGSNIVSYPFSAEDRIAYHDLVKWVASELEVDQWIINTQPTLILERAIPEKLFVDIWDNLSHKQRLEWLEAVSQVR